jgi:hypothetical protein
MTKSASTELCSLFAARLSNDGARLSNTLYLGPSARAAICCTAR